MTNKKQKEIKGEGYYYALLCDCSFEGQLICGVYPSKKEAQGVAEKVKDCPAKHTIKKCKVKITLLSKSGRGKKKTI